MKYKELKEMPIQVGFNPVAQICIIGRAIMEVSLGEWDEYPYQEYYATAGYEEWLKSSILNYFKYVKPPGRLLVYTKKFIDYKVKYEL